LPDNQSNSPDNPLVVSLVSLGCPKNLVDSEKMLAALAEGGCLVGAPMDEADVIVINTCGFLAAARDESLEVIAEAMEYKRAGRAKRIVVAGCLPSRDGAELYKIAKGIDALVGVNDREKIVQAVLAGQKVTEIDTPPQPYSRASAGDAGRFRLTPPHTAYLRIAEGCGQKCTFCTIPAIRGPLRSKPPEMVLAEAKELIADGAIELNVIAQDTTSYGRDLNGKINLAKLLHELNGLDGIEWIRLLYTYPRRFDEELIDASASCSHVLPYVDIPLQHISAGVLKRMGRGADRPATEKLLDRLRTRLAGQAVLRTTFIVGFPGETDAEFAELLQFVRDFRFDALGVFGFSAEEGTPAAAMENQLPEDVKADRVEAVMLAQQEIAFEAGRGKVGRAMDVLVDGIDSTGACVGRYYGQAPDIDGVCVFTTPVEAGRLVPVEVVASEQYDLIVQPVENR